MVGVISPFNFPQILAIRSVAPALALGNAVILEARPRTAVCGGVVLARVFEEAGLPEGLLHVLPGGPDVGQAMITDPQISVISFTGSTAAGRKVGALAGQHLKRVHLELGGNSALIVLDDADIDRRRERRRLGFLPAPGPDLHDHRPPPGPGRHLRRLRRSDRREGQPSPGRRPRLRARSRSGPIIDERQRDKVHELVTGSVEAGAKLKAGRHLRGPVL